MDITELIQSCRSGDQKSYRLLVDHLSPMLKTTACRFVTSEIAMDMLQDTYIQLFKSINRIKFIPGRELQYIHRMVINNCLKHLRKSKIIYNSDMKEIKVVGYDPQIFSQMAAKDIIQIVNELPQAAKICFYLHEIDGYSHKEIGKQLNISPSTSRANLSRAKNSLKQKLQKLDWQINEKLKRV